MSIEDLQSDFAALTERVEAFGPATSTGDLVAFLKADLVPTMGTMIEELAEMDDVIAEGDMLSEETAGIIGAPIVLIQQLMPELKAKLAADPTLVAKLTQLEQAAQVAQQAIEEIVVRVDDEVDEDEEDDEDEE